MSKDEMKNMIVGVILMDFQRTHTSMPLHDIYEVGAKEVDKNLFTVSYLSQSY
jgi:hypothetical protein